MPIFGGGNGVDVTGITAITSTNNTITVTNPAGPTVNIEVAGSGGVGFSIKTDDYIMTTNDKIILMKAENKTVTLPNATLVVAGTIYTIILDSTYELCTIDTVSAQTINNMTTYNLGSSNTTNLNVLSDGANWYISN